MNEDPGYWQIDITDVDDAGAGAMDTPGQNPEIGILKNLPEELHVFATGSSSTSSNEYTFGSSSLYYDEGGSGDGPSGSGAGALNGDTNVANAMEEVKMRRKRATIEYDEMGNRVYNVGVLMASHLGEYCR